MKRVLLTYREVSLPGPSLKIIARIVDVLYQQHQDVRENADWFNLRVAEAGVISPSCYIHNTGECTGYGSSIF